MTNFNCDKCGMINVDCGLGIFKTPREIELEKESQKYKTFLEWMLKQQYYILPPRIKNKIKGITNDNNINLN